MHFSEQTRIALRNIKHFAAGSQETHCYRASLYWDGKKIGEVSNDGHGGCDYEHPTKGTLPKWKEMHEWIAKEIDPYQKAGGDYAMTLTVDLDWICAELVNHELYRRDLQKLLKKKVVMIGKDGKCYNTKNAPTDLHLQHWVNQYQKDDDTQYVLNAMEFPEALTKYKNAMTRGY